MAAAARPGSAAAACVPGSDANDAAPYLCHVAGQRGRDAARSAAAAQLDSLSRPVMLLLGFFLQRAVAYRYLHRYVGPNGETTNEL